MAAVASSGWMLHIGGGKVIRSGQIIGGEEMIGVGRSLVVKR